MNDFPSERAMKSDPTTEEIVAEAERRIAARRSVSSGERKISPAARRVVVGADRFIYWIARHWLSIFNLVALLYVGLPLLVPVLLYVGVEGPAHVIHAMYGPLCHQLPQRSWYLFGSQLAYSQAELVQLVGPEALLQHGYLGDPYLGYKVALCQRDVAIYGTIFLAGLGFGLVRKRLKPLPIWAFLLAVLPMAIDGGVQLLSYVAPLLVPSLDLPPLESTPLRRTITGALFGLSIVWLAYPYVEESFQEIVEGLEERFGWGQ
jgi:uncharacterized membrane protein